MGWPRKAARLFRRSRLEKPVGNRPKTSKAFQVLHHRIGVAKSCSPLFVHYAGTSELLEDLFGENAVMRYALGLQQTPVGRHIVLALPLFEGH